jgi:hypothetical protein
VTVDATSLIKNLNAIESVGGGQILTFDNNR